MIAIRLTALAVALATACPGLAQSRGAPDPQRQVSPGGYDFTLMPVPEADYVQISFFWTGSAALAAPGKEGIFQIGQSLPFEQAGGRDYDTVTEDLSDAGATVILAPVLMGTVVHLLAQQADGLGIAAEIANLVLTDAALYEDDLDWLKTQAIDNLEETARDPGGLMNRALTHLLSNGDRRAAALTGRPEETIEAVTTGDIRDWMAASFGADAIVAAAGPLNAEDAGAAIDTILADLGTRPTPVPLGALDLRDSEATAVIDAPEAETALVAIAFPAVPTDAAVTVAADVLAGGDGSRIFSRLREGDGATYGVETTFTPLTPEILTVAFVTSVPPDRAAETLAVLREELSHLRAEGVTEDELAAARERQIANEDVFLRDPSTLIGIAIDQSLRNREILPENWRESIAMGDLAAIDSGIADAIPAGVVGVVVTPEPDLVGADCTAETPEDLGECTP